MKIRHIAMTICSVVTSCRALGRAASRAQSRLAKCVAMTASSSVGRSRAGIFSSASIRPAAHTHGGGLSASRRNVAARAAAKQEAQPKVEDLLDVRMLAELRMMYAQSSLHGLRRWRMFAHWVKFLSPNVCPSSPTPPADSADRWRSALRQQVPLSSLRHSTSHETSSSRAPPTSSQSARRQRSRKTPAALRDVELPRRICVRGQL